MMYLGVDIGGTDIKFGVVNDRGEVIEKKKIPTLHTTEEIINDIVAVCSELHGHHTVCAIGIASPGCVKDGIIQAPGNLPFRNVPLAHIVSDRMGLPAFAGNDAQCAGLAEAMFGAGRKASHMLLMTLGTGIGGAIVIDGRVYKGYGAGAGEVGHLTLDRTGEPCPCGRRGCLEQYASVTALIRQTIEAARSHPDSVLAKICRETEVNGRTVFHAMDEGCPIAEKVYDAYVTYLAEGIDNVVMILQPEVVVLGGAISRQGERLLAPVRKALKMPVRIAAAELGGDAGVVGAAMLCL